MTTRLHQRLVSDARRRKVTTHPTLQHLSFPRTRSRQLASEHRLLRCRRPLSLRWASRFSEEQDFEETREREWFCDARKTAAIVNHKHDARDKASVCHNHIRREQPYFFATTDLKHLVGEVLQAGKVLLREFPVDKTLCFFLIGRREILVWMLRIRSVAVFIRRKVFLA